jgi:GNAT superfamily N-acetyltransferase
VSDYRIREATLDDLDVLADHRIAMFTEMGTSLDAPVVRQMFREWLLKMMPAGEYRAWFAEHSNDGVVAGAGITLLEWPPGPSSRTGKIAFVYNVFTAPAHRKRGLARGLMDTVHTWCATHGIGAVALNAAPDARHLYASQGYRLAPGPMMWKIP